MVKAMEKVSGSNIETQAKSRNDHESPGPIIMSHLGYSESIARDGEWTIPRKYLTHAPFNSTKQLSHLCRPEGKERVQ